MQLDTERPIRRRKLIDQKKILAVASEQFRLRGYDGTSMDDIATELSVSKPSLYYRFSSKEEILVALIEESNQALDAQTSSFLDSTRSGLERLKIFLRIYLQLVTESSSALFIIDYKRFSPAAREMFVRRRRIAAGYMTDILQQGIDDGSLEPGDVALMSHGIFGMFNWVARWKVSQPDIQIEAVYEQFMAMLLGGIARNQQG